MEYYDLGPYTRTITTAVPGAQLWFDRGLNWLYGFNHAEAIACFKKALERDPGCAMAYWGMSYAAGPNYNLPWHLYDPAGKAAALATAYDAMQGGPGPRRPREPGRAGADPRPARALSTARAHRGPGALGRRLCGCHAPRVQRLPQRPRGA